MAISDQDVKAPYFPESNHFDDMRVDIAESHRRFSNLKRDAKKICRPRYENAIKLFLTRIALRLNLYEFLVVNGIMKGWLNDFENYWSNILNGRPFWNTLEFFMLLHDYRKRGQDVFKLDNPEEHIATWQHPSQLYSTFHSVRKIAVNPIRNLNLFRRFTRGANVLEYGCWLAPYYNCYREFYSHLECKWTLADIPTFPFHYAKYLYGNDASEYLLNRLNTRGLFVFNYIKSEGEGLDHPNALEMREECVRSILDKTELVYGEIKDISLDIGFCIAQKKN